MKRRGKDGTMKKGPKGAVKQVSKGLQMMHKDEDMEKMHRKGASKKPKNASKRQKLSSKVKWPY